MCKTDTQGIMTEVCARSSRRLGRYWAKLPTILDRQFLVDRRFILDSGLLEGRNLCHAAKSQFAATRKDRRMLLTFKSRQIYGKVRASDKPRKLVKPNKLS